MKGLKWKFNNKNMDNSVKAIVLKSAALVLSVTLLSTTVSHANELKASSSSMSGALNFDTSAGVLNPVDSIENTPRYLWVSDKLSFKSNESEEDSLGRSSFASGAEYWSKSKWGVSGNFSSNDSSLILGSPKNSELLNVDVNRQLVRSKNKKDYLAFGLGWQNITVDDSMEANGLRLSLLGKYSLANRLQVYGTSSWFPELERISSNSDLSGYNLEAGLMFNPKASFSLRAGFRFYDFNSRSSAVDESASTIITLGTKLSF